jgi:DNA-binding MarR family transcriptional regulator
VGRVPDAESIAEFRARPGVWLTYAGSAFLLMYAERLRPLAMKPAWVTALAILNEQTDVTQSALGRALRINRASSMALATLLESHGYISRTASTGRQRTTLALTELGRSKLKKACDLEDQLVALTMAPLGEEKVAAFVEMLKQITDAVNAIGRE